MDFVKRYYLVYILVFAGVVAAALAATRQIERTRPVAAPQAETPTIVIDAGHGGEDGGASVGGLRESDLNLSIALRMDDLCALLGLNTRMLRTEDVALYDADSLSVAQKKSSDLRNRVKLVSQTPGALLVSIHQNSYPQAKYFGAQVFYAATSGSKQLAEGLQTQLTTALDPENHRVSKPCRDVYLMEHIQCTGILVECGFLTNPAEAAKLQTAAYQKQLACTIIASVCDYLRTGGAL